MLYCCWFWMFVFYLGCPQQICFFRWNHFFKHSNMGQWDGYRPRKVNKKMWSLPTICRFRNWQPYPGDGWSIYFVVFFRFFQSLADSDSSNCRSFSRETMGFPQLSLERSVCCSIEAEHTGDKFGDLDVKLWYQGLDLQLCQVTPRSCLNMWTPGKKILQFI